MVRFYRVIFATLCVLLAQRCHSQELEIGSVEVYAAKDNSLFVRGEEPDTVSLALVNENLFVAVKFNASNVTSISWSVVIGDVTIAQPDVVLNGPVKNGYLVSRLPDVDDIPDEVYIRIPSTGSVVFSVEVSADDEAPISNGTAEILLISNFASVSPLILIIALALISRNVYISLFFGIWLGSLIITDGDVVASLKDLLDVHLIPSVTDDFNVRTIIFTLFLGGLIAQITRSGGQEGFTLLVEKFATNAKLTQISAVFAGIGLFFDDYSSALILGTSFKRLTDKFHISREKLAYVVDSTSAPIASLAPISSWIAFELGLIKDELDVIRATFAGSDLLPVASDLPQEYPFFLSTIPNRFYPIFTIVLQITLIVAGVEFGPMLYAERRARVQMRTDGGSAAMDVPVAQDVTRAEADTPRRAWNFFIPLGFFLISLIVSLVNIGRSAFPEYEQDDLKARDIFGATDSFSALVYTTLGAGIFTLFFYVLQFKEDGQIVIPTFEALKNALDCRASNLDVATEKLLVDTTQVNVADNAPARPLMYFTEGVNTWIEGFKNLMPAIIVLCLAFTVKSIVVGCATDRLFTDLIINGDVSPEALPSIIFIVASLISFCTGTSFGTMGIMFPLVSFGSFVKADGDIVLFTACLSSIMAGSIFGDHSSFISDTTILSSIGAGCKIEAHVYTQIGYAIWSAIFAVVLGTLPVGFGAGSAVMLVFGSIGMIICTLLISAPIVARSGRLDVLSELLYKVFKFKSFKMLKEDCIVFAEQHPRFINGDLYDMFVTVFRKRSGNEGANKIEEMELKPKKAVDAEEEGMVPANDSTKILQEASL